MSDAAILEKVPKEVANAISSALFRVIHQLNPTDWVLSDELNKAKTLAQYIWTHFLNENLLNFDITFDKSYKDISNWITSDVTLWNRKLDLVEFVVDKLSSMDKTLAKQFTDEINEQFERLRFGYRLVNGVVVNIVSEEEIKSVQSAINNTSDKVSYGGELYNM